MNMRSDDMLNNNISFRSVILFGAMLAAPLARADISLIATGHGAAHNGGAAAAQLNGLDTTGANLIVIITTDYVNNSCTDTPFSYATFDNKGNTYTARGPAISSSGAPDANICLWEALNPTVGSGHNFSIGGYYIAFAVAAFSGVKTSAAYETRVGSGSSGAVTSIQPGNITPVDCNQLLVTGYGANGLMTGAISVDSGYTVVDALIRGDSLNVALAYLVETSITTKNPTWSDTGNSTTMVTVTGAYKAVDGSCGGGRKRVVIQ
jgi:hypothetical protein